MTIRRSQHLKNDAFTLGRVARGDHDHCPVDLPAVARGCSRPREAARQAQCQNNMKQLGLACLSYENQHWCFPPSTYCTEGTAPAGARTHLRNWVIAILPFLEQQPLYDSFDFTGGDPALEQSNGKGNEPAGDAVPHRPQRQGALHQRRLDGCGVRQLGSRQLRLQRLAGVLLQLEHGRRGQDRRAVPLALASCGHGLQHLDGRVRSLRRHQQHAAAR